MKIGVVGAGQLGSRHLQALAKLNRPAFVQAVDNNPQALLRAKQRVAAVSPAVADFSYFTEIEHLEQEIDIAIVATNADVRRSVVQSLLQGRRVRYLLLEKFLFQNESDYDAIAQILEDSKTAAWVNCPRRIYPFFQGLRDRLIEESHVAISVKGSSWRMGRNAIHYIDLLAYLTGDIEVHTCTSLLHDRLYPGTTSETVEFMGTLECVSANGHRLTMTCYPEGEAPLILNIGCGSFQLVIHHTAEVGVKIEFEPTVTPTMVKVPRYRQSEISHKVVEELITRGALDLPTYKESAALHLSLLRALLGHMSANGYSMSRCPIT